MLTVFFFFFRFRLDSSRCYFIDESLWFRWIRYLWSWLLLLLDFHCFVWSLLVSWGIFNFGYFGCPWVINTDFIDVLSLISLDPLSLILVTSALGFSLFRLIFTCILGYLQFWLFWLCPWVINIDFIMFRLWFRWIRYLWFDFVPLDVISFLLMWFRGFFDLGAILSCDFVYDYVLFFIWLGH